MYYNTPVFKTNKRHHHHHNIYFRQQQTMSIITNNNCTVGGLPEKLIALWLADTTVLYYVLTYVVLPVGYERTEWRRSTVVAYDVFTTMSCFMLRRNQLRLVTRNTDNLPACTGIYDVLAAHVAAEFTLLPRWDLLIQCTLYNTHARCARSAHHDAWRALSLHPVYRTVYRLDTRLIGFKRHLLKTHYFSTAFM